MAVDDENKIINAPMSVTEVKTVLGESKDSVGLLCISANINQWSRYKPIYKEYLDARFHFKASGYSNSLHGLKAKFYPTLRQLGDAIAAGGTGDWTYNSASLMSQLAPKRLGDFDGYYHNAVPPFAGFHAPSSLGTTTSGMIQQAYLLEGKQSNVDADNPVAPGSIGLSQIEMTAPGMESKTLDKCHFGVALIKDNGSAVWAKSEMALIDSATGEIKAHTYSVNMDVGDVPAGEYYAVPFLSRNAVNNISSTPGKLCMVPGCMPVRVTVTASVITREDIEAIIARCVFTPLSGSGMQGVIRTAVNVISKATYDKHCTYKIYIEAEGGTHKSEQSGEFNLSAGYTYTIDYIPASTVDEAKVASVHVEVKTQRADGTQQTVSATAFPLVPDITEISKV